MGFLPPMSVAETLLKIHQNNWVLPAIQREFVWTRDQMRRLFDSLLRGYPVGSFLLWEVAGEQVHDYTFYNFLTDYHERKSPYAVKAVVADSHGVTAVLDGQQRLTAMNIGLYGTHTEKALYKHAGNPDAYQVKRLCLNLIGEPKEDDLGLKYDLQFLTDQEAAEQVDGTFRWFKVGDILKLPDGGPAIMAELVKRGFTDAQQINKAFATVWALYDAVHHKPVINAYLEQSSDADKVLDIFVRVNSGGTKLSNSDLLLSMATNQWTELDAREQVRSLVAELGETGGRFKFSKDLVLKAGLMLTDAPDIRFKISSFTRANMEQLEKNWLAIRATLLRTAGLFAAFGLSDLTLTADNAVIPIAYYLHTRDVGDSYLTSDKHAQDREKVRTWVFRSLLKRNVWGGSTDTLLARLRSDLRETVDQDGFPLATILGTMANAGRSIDFASADVEELLELPYGKARTFPTLALLYPGLDLSQQFHEDHIFPRSRFTLSKLKAEGVPDEQIGKCLERVNKLPNLQLLAGLPNIEKSDAWPWEWLDGGHFLSSEARQSYVISNDLGHLPSHVSGFMAFYEQRKQRLTVRLEKALGSDLP